MEYADLKRVISIGSAKAPALFFDEVCPLDRVAGATQRELADAIDMQENSANILASLMPNVEGPESFYRGHSGIASAYWSIVGLRQEFAEKGQFDSTLTNRDYFNSINHDLKIVLGKDVDFFINAIRNGEFDADRCRRQINRLLTNGLHNIGFADAGEWHDDYYGASDPGELGPTELYQLTIESLPMIDVDRMSWEKIIAIRTDIQARAALRDLRLMIFQDFTNKSRAQVEDMMGQAIDRYLRAVQTWKIETGGNIFSTLFSNQSAIAGVAAAAVAVVFSAPIAVAAAAAATCVLGGAAIKVATTAWTGKRKIQSDSAVRYLFQLKQF